VTDQAAARPSQGRGPNPFFYFLLFLPFGGTNGYLQLTLAYFAVKAGMGKDIIAVVIATNTIPHMFKVLWAPLVDTLWTGKRWYMLTNLVSSAMIISIGFVPITSANLGLLKWLVFFNGLSTTFVGMCTESMMARLTPPDRRGAAAGWSQAGNIGGTFVGSVGLILAQQFPQPWITSTVIGGLLLLCSVPLLFIHEPPRPVSNFIASMKVFGKSIADMVTTWRAAKITLMAAVLSLLPIGSGGAQNLFEPMAVDWLASHNVVVVAANLGSVCAIFGSLLGGILSHKMDRRYAYALCGVILALFAFGMAAGPRTPWAYIAGVAAYNIGLGLCYASFTAFVLDIIGHEGGATKYNVFASMANIPIYFMGVYDGVVAEHHGTTAMMWFDGAAGVAGAIVLVAVVSIVRLSRRKEAPSLAA
jgi:MFS family permease